MSSVIYYRPNNVATVQAMTCNTIYLISAPFVDKIHIENYKFHLAVARYRYSTIRMLMHTQK